MEQGKPGTGSNNLPTDHIKKIEMHQDNFQYRLWKQHIIQYLTYY